MRHNHVAAREIHALSERVRVASILCVHHGDGAGMCRDCVENVVYDATLVGAYIAVRESVCAFERDLFRAELCNPSPCSHAAAVRRGYGGALTELRRSLGRLAEGLAEVKDSGPSFGPCVVDA